MLILALVTVLTALLAFYCWLHWASDLEERRKGHVLPGPKPWPVIGSLHLMANFQKYPFEVFTKLQQIYGTIFQMKLGTFNCVVVSSEKDLREVLITKGDHFDGRPDWRRFDLMFGGTRRNAIAFCDFDKLQVARRRILRGHTFPNAGGDMWAKLDKVCSEEIKFVNAALEKQCNYGEAIVDMKNVLMKACSNIFSKYFCGSERKSFRDPDHNKYCEEFDKIFWEVNTGRACDFLPWLLQAPWQHKSDVKRWTASIRHYVVTNFVEKQEAGSDDNLISALIKKVDQDLDSQDPSSQMSLDHALYAIEDILGGHCAVANFAIRALIDIATRPRVQTEVRAEIQSVLGGDDFSLADKKSLTYLQATFYETVRHTCSAIVPHVANRNTSIAGYKVEANTVIFVNNHHANFSEDFWDTPETYSPERFITEDNSFKKPKHFQPFSVGKRQCMGYKMVEHVTSFLLASILAKFEVKCHDAMRDQPLGQLGLEPKPFYFTVRKTGCSSTDSPCRHTA